MLKLLRLPDVVGKTGLGRSTIYELCSRGEFPERVRLTTRTVGWRSTDVDEWMNQRRSAREEVERRSDKKTAGQESKG